jgi:hypothetical protein
MSKLIAFVLLAGAIAVLTAIPAAAKTGATNGTSSTSTTP